MKKYVLILILFTLISSCEKQDLEIRPKNLDKIDSTFLSKISKSKKVQVKKKKKKKKKILERWQSGRMRQS